MQRKYFLILIFAISVIGIVIGLRFLITTVALNSETQPVVAGFSNNASNLRELKEYFKNNILSKGPEEAYITFISEIQQDGEITTHDQAHAFGEALYETQGIDGLQYCDASFDFGCYHSFFGSAVAQQGIGVLSQLDQACRTKFGSYNLPCQHGIGHGVLVYADYSHIDKALELCETISTEPTGGCSSGVFMEYNFHTMNALQGSDFIRGKEDGLYAPCDSLPERFQGSCYNEQVQWWQNLFNSDFEYIGSLCQELSSSPTNYESCFHGIGNYLSASVSLDENEILSGCSKMPDEKSEAYCIEGSSWLIRGDGAGTESAQRVCMTLNSPYKETCIKKVLRN